MRAALVPSLSRHLPLWVPSQTWIRLSAAVTSPSTASSCIIEVNPASNRLGARHTPSCRIAWKNAAKLFVSTAFADLQFVTAASVKNVPHLDGNQVVGSRSSSTSAGAGVPLPSHSDRLAVCNVGPRSREECAQREADVPRSQLASAATTSLLVERPWRRSFT